MQCLDNELPMQISCDAFVKGPTSVLKGGSNEGHTVRNCICADDHRALGLSPAATPPHALTGSAVAWWLVGHEMEERALEIRKYEFTAEPNQKSWRRRDNLERRISADGSFNRSLMITLHSTDCHGDHELLERLAVKGFRITIEENP